MISSLLLLIPSPIQADSENERRRLSEFYAGLADEELEKLAADAVALTEAARQVLRDGLNRRGLGVVLSESARVDEIEVRKLVTIRQFRYLPEALLAKGKLDSASVECFLADDNMVRLDWLISDLLGGIKLQVNAEDVDAAHEILNQPIPEGFEVEGVGEYQQPRCPKCDSLDVSFEELNRPIAYGSLFLGFPVPIHRKGWVCHACGHKWESEAESDITAQHP